MNAYDYLAPPLQMLVDRLAVETAPSEDWEVHRAYLASVFLALERHGPPLDPQEELSLVIAGLVERLGEPEIASAVQAGIYAASAKLEHRQAAAEWFDRHPDQFDAIQARLVRGSSLH